MSDALKKPKRTQPESYKPDLPSMMDKLEGLSSENVIDTVTVEGVEFTIIQKPRTYYAGVYGCIDDLNWKPNIYSWGALDEGYDKKILTTIKDSTTPDCEITLYIDYASDDRPSAMLCGQETTSPKQPDGIHVIEAEPSMYIRVKHTHDAYALTKKITNKYLHQYHMLDLHDLIKHLFCSGEECIYEPNGSKQNGNEDMQIVYSNEVERYASVPVKIKTGHEKSPIKLNIDYPYVKKSPFKTGIDFTKSLADIDAAQEPPKEFEKIRLANQDWLVLEKQGNNALIISETIITKKAYHNTKTEMSWAQSDIRSYLNNEFYNTFHENDKARIQLSKVLNPPQAWHGTDSGIDTNDYIFLLSMDEVVKYFGDSGDWAMRKGWWANHQGFWLGNGFGQIFFDQYNASRIAKDTNGENASWRTRTLGRLSIYTVVVDAHGICNITGWSGQSNEGIRPAMWVSI